MCSVPLVMMHPILIIGSDKQLVRGLKWKLEDAGFVVSVSQSLEETFFQVTQPDVSLIIIEEKCALSGNYSQTQALLNWFRRHYPLLLLCQDECGNFVCQSCCFRQAKERQTVLSCIQTLGFRANL